QSGALPGLFLPLHGDGQGHMQAVGWPCLPLFENHAQAIVLPVGLDCGSTDTQLRRSRPCDPLLEYCVHVFSSHTRKSAAQGVKPGTLEQVVTVKRPQGTEKNV